MHETKRRLNDIKLTQAPSSHSASQSSSETSMGTTDAGSTTPETSPTPESQVFTNGPVNADSANTSVPLETTTFTQVPKRHCIF